MSDLAQRAAGNEPGPLDTSGGPRPSGERIAVIDAVRGVALLGILVVNSLLFFWPVHAVALGLPEPAGPLDAAVAWIVSFAFEGKYFTVFSLLFGIGVAMQLGRGHAPSRIRRRLLVLGGIGALHVSLFWWGDILLHYAILGGVLLLTRDWGPRRLVRGALIFLAVPIVFQLAFAGLAGLASLTPDGSAALEAGMADSFDAFVLGHEAGLAIYGSSDASAMVTRRWGDWAFATLGTLLNGMLAIVVAMFLLGAAAHKAGWTRPDAADSWRWTFRRALPVALVANAVFASVGGPEAYAGGWPAVVIAVSFVVGAPSGALTIASGAALLLRGGGPATVALAAVGRLALSTYLTQSLVFTTLAYGYAVGWYGAVTHAQAFGLALLVFAIQVPIAVAYTRRFSFGPVEWVWRALTYGTRPTRRSGA
jgi:uncharacterized protein